MPHYLDPRNDLTFKRVFGEHKHLCMSLINSLLPLEKPVTSIEYQTGELLPDIPELRNSIVDVRCSDETGRHFIVEMQMHWTALFKSRVLFNASKAYVRQLGRGESYELLQPVYAINFVNDTFEKSDEMKDEYWHYYKIVNIRNTEKQIKGLEFLFIELPKFKPQNRAEKKLHELWLRFLTEINERTEKVPQVLMENALTSEAVGYMERAAYSSEQLDAYYQWKIDIMTVRSIYTDASHARKEGLAEGLAEGRAEGESKKGMEVALNLLKKGMSIEDISDVTGLSKHQIEELKNR